MDKGAFLSQIGDIPSKGASPMYRKLLSFTLVLAMTAVSACSTVEGAGQDLKDASQGTKRVLKDAAN